MSQAGQPVPANSGVSPAVTTMLHHGLELADDLSRKLQALDDLLLTGKPHEIADAALLVETSLRAASPAFMNIASAMETLGASNLQNAADKFRRSEQAGAASLADALRSALASFARRSVAANRRAQHLNRGLNAALRSLQAMGLEDTGRLIAKA